MNIIDKKFTETKTANDISLNLDFVQERDASVTAIGKIVYYDNNGEVKTIEQPLPPTEVAKFNVALNQFKTWILAQNGTTLT